MERLRVLVVSPGRMLEQAVSALSAAAAEWEPDPTRALDKLVHGVLDVGLVSSDLGRGSSGADLVTQAIARGCTVPLILVGRSGDGHDEEAALAAGAAACIDLSRGRPQDLEWAITFAHAARMAREARQGDAASGVSAFLGDQARRLLGEVDARVQTLGGSFPAGHPDSGVCKEIQSRLAAFKDTLDTATHAIRAGVPYVPARPLAPRRPSAPSSTAPAPRGRSSRPMVVRQAVPPALD